MNNLYRVGNDTTNEIFDFVSTTIFKEFGQGRYGLGTALSSILFVFMVIVGYFVIRLMDREPVLD